jgi:hypothetical protein
MEIDWEAVVGVLDESLVNVKGTFPLFTYTTPALEATGKAKAAPASRAVLETLLERSTFLII